MKHFILLVLSILCCWSSTLSAQTSQQIVPRDTAIRYGVLPNGLTYYVRRATKKKQMAEFRLVQRTGSLVETEQERGMAHFLEHMLFRGTTHFPDNAVLDYLRRNGIAFGPDVNARTSYDFTEYKLSEVPIAEESKLDSCMLILRDWCADATIDQKAVEMEREVIVEEWRARNNDVSKDVISALWGGSRYAQRIPIGDMEVIRSCSARQMQAFYHRWYQPQNQCVVAVGDFDPDKMVQRIVALFADLKRGKNSPSTYPLPYLEQPKVVISRHPQIPMAACNLMWASPSVPQYDMQTVQYFRERETKMRAIHYMREGLDQLKKEHTDIPQTLIDYQKNVPNFQTDMIILIGLSSGSDWRNLLTEVLTTVERQRHSEVKLRGYVDSQGNDLRTEEDTTLLKWENPKGYGELDEDDIYPNPAAENCVEHYLKGTTGISPSTQRIIDIYNNGHITAGRIQYAMQQIFDVQHCVVQIILPDKPEVVSPSESEVLALIDRIAMACNGADTVSDSEKDVRLKTLAIDPVPGSVVERTDCPVDTNYASYLLSNGVKVFMNRERCMDRNTTRIRGFVRGGKNVLESVRDYSNYSMAIETAIRNYDEYEHAEIDVNYADAEMTFETKIDSLRLDDTFRVLHARLTTTEIDTALYESSMTQLRNMLPMAYGSPQVMAMIQCQYFQYVPGERNDMDIPLDSAMACLERTSIGGMRDMLSHMHGNYNGMQVVVNTPLCPDSLLPYICKYLGSLPAGQEPMCCTDYPEMHYKQYDDEKLVRVKGETYKSTVVMMLGWEQNLDYSVRHLVHQEALCNVLNQALTNRIRLKNSDVYHIGVKSQVRDYPVPQLLYTVQFVCDPAREKSVRAEVRALLHEVAEGDVLSQQLLDGFLNYKKKRIASHSRADEADWVLYQNCLHDGVVVPSQDISVYQTVSLASLRDFARQLLQHGHWYEYVIQEEK
ncbi:MAG: insulinase family protein [Bacteroidales bacterium]|nr:insulinase family protein [Bacteroidales bacterium]